MKTLEARFADLYKRPLRIRTHENISTYLRAEMRQGILCLHLHRLFVEAPTPVLEAVLRFACKKDRAALQVIRQMADLYFSENPQRKRTLTQKGEVYDLGEIYARVKAQYFSPDFHADISWSEKVPRKKFRSITFGTYERARRLIRINRYLDRIEVPLYFIEFIVYHEMLHGVHLPITRLGRTSIHTPQFKEQERKFPQYAQAKQWQKTIFSGVKYGRS